MSPTKPKAEATAKDPVMHHKPIALRMTQSEREEAFALAAEDGRSASNFALLIYRRGVADYKAKREVLRNAAAS